MLNPSRILVLSPHTDDGELGCGGSIAKYAATGSEIYYVAFSDCKKSLPVSLSPDTLQSECIAATETLGIKKANLIFLDFEVRMFPSFRQDILEEMVKLNKSLKPDLVFTLASTDVHQDHAIVYAESLRAFKNCSLLGYELPWNNKSFQTDCFISLSEENLNKKIKALESYKSQAHRSYFNNDFISSLATVRGLQGNTKYAEAFQLHRICL